MCVQNGSQRFQEQFSWMFKPFEIEMQTSFKVYNHIRWGSQFPKCISIEKNSGLSLNVIYYFDFHLGCNVCSPWYFQSRDYSYFGKYRASQLICVGICLKLTLTAIFERCYSLQLSQLMKYSLVGCNILNARIKENPSTLNQTPGATRAYFRRLTDTDTSKQTGSIPLTLISITWSV